MDFGISKDMELGRASHPVGKANRLQAIRQLPARIRHVRSVRQEFGILDLFDEKSRDFRRLQVRMSPET